MDSELENMTREVKNMTQEVEKITGKSLTPTSDVAKKSFYTTISTLDKKIIFASVFVLVFMVTVAFRPPFLYVVKDGKKIFSYKKLCIFTGLFCIVSCVAYFTLANSKFFRK